MNPVDIPNDDKAERMAAKRTERLRAREGLFAEFVEPITKEQIQAAARQHHERFEATLESLRIRGEAFRGQVKALLSEVEFAALETQFSRTPGTPEYLADFWRQELKRLGLDPA